MSLGDTNIHAVKEVWGTSVGQSNVPTPEDLPPRPVGLVTLDLRATYMDPMSGRDPWMGQLKRDTRSINTPHAPQAPRAHNALTTRAPKNTHAHEDCAAGKPSSMDRQLSDRSRQNARERTHRGGAEGATQEERRDGRDLSGKRSRSPIERLTIQGVGVGLWSGPRRHRQRGGAPRCEATRCGHRECAERSRRAGGWQLP